MNHFRQLKGHCGELNGHFDNFVLVIFVNLKIILINLKIILVN